MSLDAEDAVCAPHLNPVDLRATTAEFEPSELDSAKDRFASLLDPADLTDDDEDPAEVHLTRISNGFLKAKGLIRPQEELDALVLRMNELGWKREDIEFFYSLDGALIAPAREHVYAGVVGNERRLDIPSISLHIRGLVKKGVQAVVVRRMAEVYEMYKNAGIIIYVIERARELNNYDTEFLLSELDF
jgi:hypothetical protein